MLYESSQGVQIIKNCDGLNFYLTCWQEAQGSWIRHEEQFLIHSSSQSIIIFALALVPVPST